MLVCDGCAARFTRHHVSVRATRVAAENAGWKVGDHLFRRDYCAACRKEQP